LGVPRGTHILLQESLKSFAGLGGCAEAEKAENAVEEPRVLTAGKGRGEFRDELGAGAERWDSAGGRGFCQQLGTKRAVGFCGGGVRMTLDGCEHFLRFLGQRVAGSGVKWGHPCLG